MVLAWIPVLGLLQRHILSLVGPWAYLSAMFYLFNVVVSMLVSNQWIYRVLLLALTVAMLLTLSLAHPPRAAATAAASDRRVPARIWTALRWIACARAGGGRLCQHPGQRVAGVDAGVGHAGQQLRRAGHVCRQQGAAGGGAGAAGRADAAAPGWRAMPARCCRRCWPPGACCWCWAGACSRCRPFASTGPHRPRCWRC